MIMDNIIEIKNLVYEYTEENETFVAVNNVSLDIKRGSFTVILGHNGSGKSTLAKLMNGLNKPTYGEVLVNGINTKDEEKELEIKRLVGMVFQNPDNQLVASVVEEDVAFGPENLGLSPETIRHRVDDALKSVGMYDFRKSTPHRLSGGQKQRIAIAGIIAMEPECLVLDEPTAMLDPKGREEVISAVKKLNREQGITVVLITHNMDETVDCDRVVVMDSGKILRQGTPREVFSQVDFIRRHRLDVPQATELCSKLKSSGLNLKELPLDTDECIEMLSEVLL